MDDLPAPPLNVKRALRQCLQSLQRAGVEQLPHVASRYVPGTATADTRSVHVAQVAPPTVSRAAASPLTVVGPGHAVSRPLLSTEPTMKKPASPSPATKKLKAAEKKVLLSSLCDRVKSCHECAELSANRTQTVFGVGNPQTRLCFFGEAPGADEDRLGEPFVGRAGQLLDKIIEACTLKRSDVYILNTVKCRPPGNRNPTPEEIDRCRPFFEQQLEIIRPDFICCLGLVSATALLDTKLSIGKLRGQLHPWRWAKVLVTYHPAYLLRNPPAKRLVWEDMQFLMGEMGIEL